MKIPMKFKTTTPSLLVALGLALACFGFLPNAKAIDVEQSITPAGNQGNGEDVLINLTTGAWNTGVGFEALTSETTGNLNTAIGVRALTNDNGGEANTANGMMALFSNVTGAQNVAVGAQALVANIDGVSNTAAGTQALFANITGAGNCAVGQWALAFNDGGTTSNAFGYAALFNNDTDANNAFGFAALASNVTGPGNSAFGDEALILNVISSDNCAFGTSALFSNDSGAAGLGNGNNAFGVSALESNGDGNSNNAFGFAALFSNDDGVWNNAFGTFALVNNVSGNFNTAIGDSAGSAIDGDGNVCIGEGVVGEAGVNDSTYVRNVNTTVQAGAGFDTVTVRLADGRLGHAVSSRRYKDDIKPMDKASEALFALKPVMFRYKKQIDPEQGLDYGLIAEDVAKVAPELAIHNEKGEIENVRYQAIYAMMLNEFLKEHSTVEQLKSAVAKQEAIIAQQQKGMEVLTAQLKDQAAQIQKVSAQLEVSKPAPQVVLSTP
jgi:uncharacterized coiled-coil protein SlyX